MKKHLSIRLLSVCLIILSTTPHQSYSQELVWASYLGGTGSDEPGDITVDSEGNLYITGKTNSMNFPATPEAVHNTPQSDSDGFLTKFSSSGELLYSGFLGAANNGKGTDIEVNGTGIYVAGITTNAYFFTSTGAYLRTPAPYHSSYDNSNHFILKFNPEGTQFLSSTFFWGDKIALDTRGNVYVTGATNASNLPTSSDAFDRTFNGGMDAFVSKLDPTLGTLIYSTYLGGSREDGRDTDLQVDEAGNVYFATTTYSSDYPTTPGVFDLSFEENEYESDIVISKLNMDASTLLYSTYLGCSRDDSFPCIAINPYGNLYIYGITAVGGGGVNNFPVTQGAYDTRTTRHYSAFISRFNNSASQLDFSTFFGGIINEGYDISLGGDLVVDYYGNAYIVGEVNTYNSGIPISQNAIVNDYYPGDFSYFLAVFNPEGNRLIYSTYLGVRDSRNSCKAVLDGQGNLYIAGKTKESNFPATDGAFCTTYNGGDFDVFIMKINISGITGLENITHPIPDEYALYQNYPNPFNPSTEITYSIPEGNFVTLSVFNLIGEKIISLFEGMQSAGHHTVSFDGSFLPGGVYFCRLTSADWTETIKIILLK